VKWLVRWIERITGIDAVSYWKDRHEATLELLRTHVEGANKQIAQDEQVIRAQTEEMNKLRERTIKAEVGLKVEQNTRKMLQNLIAEIGAHAARNIDVAPKTMLAVIHASCVEATQLAESWVATGVVDAAEIVNIRATMANRLLPDPKPGAINVLDTQRKRDGRAGDTTVRPRPDQLHRYEYNLFKTSNAGGMSCNLCGKPMADPIHLDVKTSGSITAEKRPDDTPPQTLPPASEMK
jgi:hypothetical protein